MGDAVVGALNEDGLLSDVVVVEVASEVAGPFAARLLADLGARCLKVEPPDGDPARSWGPFRDGVVDIDASGAFLVWNHGKESVVLDLDSTEGAAALDAMLATAHVLVEDGRLDVHRLRSRFPHLVIVSVTPFGREGWGAGRPGTDAVAYAMGGAMSSTGRPDRPPYHLGGSLIQAFVGSAAATAAMAGLLAAEATGDGQWIDVAWVEAEAGSVDRAAPYLLGYIYSGLEALQEPTRARGLPGGSYPCADGDVVASTYGWTIARMLDTVGDPELDAVLRESLGNVYRPVGREVLDRVLPAWFASHTKEEITELSQSKGWAVTPSNTVLEVSEDPFLLEAGVLERVDAGPLGELALPGPAFVTEGGPRFRWRAPDLGQHTEAVLAESRAGSGRVNPAQPLAGVRVLDLCVVFSGPFASMVLADLGADVIKVESRQHYPDTTKGPRRFTPKAVDLLDNTLKGYVGADPGAQPWNRSARVDVVSRNKRSMTVDLTRDEGREVFLDLVERSDVVMENNAPGLLRKLRLEWDVLHARNPSLILLRMPALGLDGRAALSGVGSNFEAMVALPSFRGYPDLPARQQQYTFRMDAATGTGGALAVMAALRRARRTGEGREIVLSQTTNLLHQSADVLVAAQITGQDPPHPGNGHARLAPHGCYPTSVEDRWVVIACRDDADWDRLVRALGQPAWADDADLATMEGRHRREAELDAHLAAWTARRTGADVEALLVAAGVPVSPVLRESDKVDHPQFVSRDWFVTMDHPEAGRRRFPGHMWRTTAGRLRADRPTTRLGQDNDDIYRHVLGYDDERIEALTRSGHIGTRYEFEESEAAAASGDSGGGGTGG